MPDSWTMYFQTSLLILLPKVLWEAQNWSKVCFLFLELEFYFKTPSKKTFLDKPRKNKKHGIFDLREWGWTTDGGKKWLLIILLFQSTFLLQYTYLFN